MGNSGSQLSSVGHVPSNGKLYKFNTGLREEDEKKKKKKEVGPIHVVGTVSASERALLSPFGEDVGVACQVSVFKNDGYQNDMEALEYLFTGTEAVKFSVSGHAIEGGGMNEQEQTFIFDADMSKIIFKLRQTHLEKYITFDKKNRILRSHPTSNEWAGLYDRPLANKFWERHAHNSRKGEMATLRSMLNAPIPVPRLAKERVLAVGDPVAIWATPRLNADGTVTLMPTDDGRIVITNSPDILKSLNYRKPTALDAILAANEPEITPMGVVLKAHTAVEYVPSYGDDDDDDDDNRGRV